MSPHDQFPATRCADPTLPTRVGHRIRVLRFLSGLAMVLIVEPAAVAQDCLVQEFTPASGFTTNLMGLDIASDGDFVAVACPSIDHVNSCSQSEVRIYRRNGQGWNLHQLIRPTENEPGGKFGVNVELSGTALLIGEQGAVHCYRFSDSEQMFVLEQFLVSPGNAFWYFGYTFALDGELLLVSGGSDVFTYRYEASSATWVLEQTIERYSPQFAFGGNLDIRGQTAVVSAEIYSPHPALLQTGGAAIVYRYDPLTSRWAEVQRLTSSTPSWDDRFAWAVAINPAQDRIAVGAPTTPDASGYPVGSVYVFARDPVQGGWVEESRIDSPSPLLASDFGDSLQWDADSLYVYGDQHGGTLFRYRQAPSSWELETATFVAGGSNYYSCRSFSVHEETLFARTWVGIDISTIDPVSENWAVIQQLSPDLGPDRRYYGSAVCADGEVAVFASRWDRDSLRDRGTARVFRRESLSGDWTEEQALTLGPGTEGIYGFGHAVAVRGSRIIVGAVVNSTVDIPGAAVIFQYDPDEERWIREAVLQDPSFENEFGRDVDIEGNFALVGGGHTSVYRWSELDSEWELTQQFEAWNTFGSVVALRGEYAIVGRRDIARFDHASDSWVLDPLLTPPADFWHGLGFSAQLEKDSILADGSLLISAVDDEENGAEAGALFHVKRDSGSGEWTVLQKLSLEEDSGTEKFGRFEVGGDWLAVSSRTQFVPFVGRLGVVDIYRWSPSLQAWIHAAHLPESSQISPASYPELSLTGGVLFWGNPFDPSTCNIPCPTCGSGMVQRYDLSICVADTLFIRGDANMDGEIDLSDPLDTLRALSEQTTFICADARDFNDDGSIDLSDVVMGLAGMFGNGGGVLLADESCVVDQTPDAIDCAISNCP